jgi:hypothetical protein
VVFVLTSKRTYNLSRTFVRQNLLPIIELPNLGRKRSGPPAYAAAAGLPRAPRRATTAA